MENILTRQSVHPLHECLAELKFSRPTKAQEMLDNFIEQAKELGEDSCFNGAQEFRGSQPEEMSTVVPIREGIEKKGGVRKAPTRPRPSPPRSIKPAPPAPNST